jgi:hypothetical protein
MRPSNQEEHERLDGLISSGFARVDQQFKRTNGRISVAGVIVAVATVGLPVWGNLRAAESAATVKETARQEFVVLKSELRSEYVNECRSRDADLSRIADQAAARVVEALHATPRD